MYKIKYLNDALSDLKVISHFIAIKLRNPKYARKVIKQIKEKVKS